MVDQFPFTFADCTLIIYPGSVRLPFVWKVPYQRARLIPVTGIFHGWNEALSVNSLHCLWTFYTCHFQDRREKIFRDDVLFRGASRPCNLRPLQYQRYADTSFVDRTFSRP